MQHGTLALSVAVTILALFSPTSAYALKFSNSFTEFELPAGWNCALDESTWTCQVGDETTQGDAVMVLAAKKKADGDSLAAIQAYLEKSRSIKSETGQNISSKPNYVKSASINGQVWVDALHIESEMPGFYTRYIATIKDDIMVLITYSIEKSKYDAYVPQLEKLVQSVKVFRPTEAAPQRGAPPPQQNLAQGIRTGPALPAFPDNLSAAKEAPVQKTAKSDSGGGASLLLLLLIGAGGFFIYKKKKQQQQGSS